MDKSKTKFLVLAMLCTYGQGLKLKVSTSNSISSKMKDDDEEEDMMAALMGGKHHK